MGQSLASRIEAANSALMVDGNVDAVDEFFTPDYVAHLTDQEMTGGHDAIRSVIGMYRRASPISRSRSRSSWKGRTELPGKGRSGLPIWATSRDSLPLVVPSCGATW